MDLSDAQEWSMSFLDDDRKRKRSDTEENEDDEMPARKRSHLLLLFDEDRYAQTMMHDENEVQAVETERFLEFSARDINDTCFAPWIFCPEVTTLVSVLSHMDIDLEIFLIMTKYLISPSICCPIETPTDIVYTMSRPYAPFILTTLKSMACMPRKRNILLYTGDAICNKFMVENIWNFVQLHPSAIAYHCLRWMCRKVMKRRLVGPMAMCLYMDIILASLDDSRYEVYVDKIFCEVRAREIPANYPNQHVIVEMPIVHQLQPLEFKSIFATGKGGTALILEFIRSCAILAMIFNGKAILSLLVDRTSPIRMNATVAVEIMARLLAAESAPSIIDRAYDTLKKLMINAREDEADLYVVYIRICEMCGKDILTRIMLDQDMPKLSRDEFIRLIRCNSCARQLIEVFMGIPETHHYLRTRSFIDQMITSIHSDENTLAILRQIVDQRIKANIDRKHFNERSAIRAINAGKVEVLAYIVTEHDVMLDFKDFLNKKVVKRNGEMKEILTIFSQ